MDKINIWDHGTDSWVGFFILESLSRSEDNPMLHKGYDPSNMAATLMINGIELPLVETFKYIGSQFEVMVKKEAEKLVTDRLDVDFMESLHNISRLSNELEDELRVKIDNMMRFK